MTAHRRAAIGLRPARGQADDDLDRAVRMSRSDLSDATRRLDLRGGGGQRTAGARCKQRERCSESRPGARG